MSNSYFLSFTISLSNYVIWKNIVLHIDVLQEMVPIMRFTLKKTLAMALVEIILKGLLFKLVF